MSYDKYMFNLVRYFQMVPEIAVAFPILPAAEESFNCSKSLIPLRIVSVLIFHHSVV